ncbi:hypothetical protein U0L90_02590 [Flavobacteriaceae sp. LMIT009]
MFNELKTNATIKKATGFIYLDIDGNTEINLNNSLIFASWLSVSGQGRGVLVKVNGLTLGNFKTTYVAIAKELNIKADINANRATQYCIHSYDEDLYINNDSLTYVAKPHEEITVTPRTEILKKKKKDSTEKGVNKEWNYNNINDFDFKGRPYLFFPQDKAPFAVAFIPKNIPIGSRNQILSALAYQMRALNPNKLEKEFIQFMLNINSSRCEKPLEDTEVMSISKKILKLKEINPIFNKKRRVLFNPDFNLTKGEKIRTANKLLGSIKSKKTKTEIESCLNNWNFKNYGKVTQKKLARVSKKNIKTIEKYYKFFKDDVQSINQSFFNQ